VPLEQEQPLVDLLRQAELLDHQVHGPKPATVDRAALLGHLVVNIARSHHRLGLIAPRPFRVEAACNSLLAVADDLRVGSVHSKCSFFFGGLRFATSPNQDWMGISSFFS